jgi:hypothetical protein
MPINRLLQNSKLDPAEREVLTLAYTSTLRLLHLKDRSDPISEIVARKIIEIGATVASDPLAISESAARQLTLPVRVRVDPRAGLSVSFARDEQTDEFWNETPSGGSQ